MTIHNKEENEMNENLKENYLNINIDYGRNKLLTEQGLVLLEKQGFYKMDHETSPQQTFARAATAYCFGDLAFAQRLYDYVSKGWFMFASPVLTNAPEVMWPSFTESQWDEARVWFGANVPMKALPISCYLSSSTDELDGLIKARSETAYLSAAGGGIGVYMANRAPDGKSTGVLSHLRGYDADALSYKQTSSRRGSIAAYLRVDHPEIKHFLEMRNPIGGDANKKCLNLHQGLVLTDAFMEAVVRGDDYPLVDPKHGETGETLNAREVWEEVMQMRFETGEPYLLFVDTVNKNLPKQITNPMYHVTQSNLCVAPETLVLTSKGQQVISELVDQEVEVWNGKQFSKTTVRKTGVNQKLIKVSFSNGSVIECTPYHKFYVKNDYHGAVVEVRAADLSVGDKMIKFDLPTIKGERLLDHAYANGFYSGDGCEVRGRQRLYFYGEKQSLIQHCGDIFTSWYDQPDQDRQYGETDKLQNKFFVPDASYTVGSRLEWLAGLFDSDGCVLTNGNTQSIQVGSIRPEFLNDVRMMLQTLGVNAKVTKVHDGGVKMLPKNDGSDEFSEFVVQPFHRLLIGQSGVRKLVYLGLTTHRLVFNKNVPNRNAEQFIKVNSVVDAGRISDTYCFTEQLRNMGMFNGILTGNCSEITLYTSASRTAVCCLSSLNLEYYDEWKDTNIVEDLVRMLDNVLETFLLKGDPNKIPRALRSARKERAIGLGTFGFHSLLQRKNIPFESGGFGSATQVNNIVYSTIKERAYAESQRLAASRGEPTDCAGSGFRNSHLTALAPNASSSAFFGASPSVEPLSANLFTSSGRAGNHTLKNKYLEQQLEILGLNTKEVWQSIKERGGSVQHIDELPESVKMVFRTAREIDQRWIIEHAAARQKYIDQSQSVNLFVESDVTMQMMSDLHILAWFKGLKSLYYLRANAGKKADISVGGAKKSVANNPVKFDLEECLSCEG